VCSAFDTAIQNSTGLEVVPVTREILIEAAGIRAQTGVKLPDAIHLSTAIVSGCASFLTNDKSLLSLRDLKVIYLSNLPG
jgi:predicted nucleic acid-binding protein